MLIIRSRAADGDIVAASGAIGGSPVVLFVSPRDGDVRRQLVLPFAGNFNAGDILDRSDGVVVVGSFEDPDRPLKGDMSQDVLVYKVR